MAIIFYIFKFLVREKMANLIFEKKRENMHKKYSHFISFCHKDVKICHKENVAKMFPFRLFLSPRCENLPQRKCHQNVPHFTYFCGQDVKICQKENNRQNVPISFISVAKMLKICHKEKCHQNVPPFCLFLLPRCENLSNCHKENVTKIMFPISFISVCHKEKSRQNGSHFLYFCRQDVKICQKEKAHQFPPVQHIYGQIRTWVQQRSLFLKCNLPWTVPLVLDLQ
jgi:hypothetical protein